MSIYVTNEDEKNICYIEGSLADKNAAEEVSELHENVWYKLKPPKHSKALYTPFVTARQIDLVRTLLIGRNAAKVTNCYKTEQPIVDKVSEESICTYPPRRESDPQLLSINKKKSSVKFLTKTVYT